MSPLEAKALSDRIDRLEKKFDVLLRRLADQPKQDWIEDPKLTRSLHEAIAASEDDITSGRYELAENVWKELGV